METSPGFPAHADNHINGNGTEFPKPSEKPEDSINDVESIRPNKLTLKRALSSPSPVKPFTLPPTHKGLMEKFISSRGKFTPTSSQRINRSQDYSTISRSRSTFDHEVPEIPPITLNQKNLSLFLTAAINPPKFDYVDAPETPIIERDENGKPIRKGYVPVHEKIQSEIQALQQRENELKCERMQKLSTLGYERYGPNDVEIVNTNDVNGNVNGESLPNTETDLNNNDNIPNGNFLSQKSYCDQKLPIKAGDRFLTQILERQQKLKTKPLPLTELVDHSNTQEVTSPHKLIEKFEILIQDYKKENVVSKSH
jgi:hypothetical protein